MKKILSMTLLTLGVLGFASLAFAQDVFTYNLHTGMKNDTQVSLLQNLLLSEGYLSGTTATGNFGNLTKNAVKTFQSESGINPTGFVGPATRKALNALYGGGTQQTSTLPIGCDSKAGFSSISGISCATVIAPPPSVTIAPVSVSNISSTTANLASSYQAKTNSSNTVWFEYALDQASFTNGTQTKIGETVLQGQTSTFSSILVNLTPSQTYYVRAVVEGQDNTTDTSSIVSFTAGATGSSVGGTVTGTYQNQSTAQPGQPYVGTVAASSITDTTAVVSGVFDGQGSQVSVSFQYWSSGGSLNTTQVQQMGTGSGSISTILSGLTPGGNYSFRIIATNANGTVTGDTLHFMTTPPSGNSNYVYVYGGGGGSNNTSACSGVIPNVTGALASGSAAGNITAATPGTALLTATLSTNCDASLKSLTFTSSNSSAFSTYSGFAVYEGNTPLSGTFSGGTFTLSTSILIAGGTAPSFTLKATTPSNATGTVSFGLSNITATSASGVTNQYSASVSGHTLTYVLQINIYNNNNNQLNGGLQYGTAGGTGSGTTGSVQTGGTAGNVH